MAIVGSAPAFIASKTKQEIESLVHSITGAIYFSSDSTDIYLGTGYQAKKYGGGEGSFVGADINGIAISAIKTIIESGDILNIPTNFEYNCTNINIIGSVNCDGVLNII